MKLKTIKLIAYMKKVIRRFLHKLIWELSNQFLQIQGQVIFLRFTIISNQELINMDGAEHQDKIGEHKKEYE